MKLMPIVYVTDIDRALAFYRALGLRPGAKERSNMWAELHMGDAVLGLHYIARLPETQVRQVELSMITDQPLEKVVANLKAQGVELYREITDEAFGRSIMVRDPDGLAIQINEYDESLYT